MTTIPSAEHSHTPLRKQSSQRQIWRFLVRNPTLVAGLMLLVLFMSIALLAPVLGTVNPTEFNVMSRLKGPSAEHWFGTDMLGRDVYSRTIYGSRISLIVGLSVSVIATAIGLVIGLLAGYIPVVDSWVMRIMDGLMAIPGILLAIALMALLTPSVQNVVIALVIPQVPRVARLVRGVVLSLREEPFVEAAVALGAGLPRVLFRHIMPNTFAPLTVQATYISAAAVLIEASLSFLGAGTPTEIPSWGNMMAEGKVYLQLAIWIILYPGLFLALTVLAINMVGDGLRDFLDPRMSSRM